MKKKILALIFALVLALCTVLVVYADDIAQTIDTNSLIQALNVPEGETLVSVLLFEDGDYIYFTTSSEYYNEAPTVVTEAELANRSITIP